MVDKVVRASVVTSIELQEQFDAFRKLDFVPASETFDDINPVRNALQRRGRIYVRFSQNARSRIVEVQLALGLRVRRPPFWKISGPSQRISLLAANSPRKCLRTQVQLVSKIHRQRFVRGIT